MPNSLKIIIILSFIFNGTLNSYLPLEPKDKPIIKADIINNSYAGVKVKYLSEDSLLAQEKFIQSKQSFITPALQSKYTSNGPNKKSSEVLINTFKGPLSLNITVVRNDRAVPSHLSRRGRLNPYAPQPRTEIVENIEVIAELIAEYPIAHARFISGRPWDEYKIQVILDEKQLEKSTLSIAYKQLEKPELIKTSSPERSSPVRFRESPSEYTRDEGRVGEIEDDPTPQRQTHIFSGMFDESGQPMPD